MLGKHSRHNDVIARAKDTRGFTRPKITDEQNKKIGEGFQQKSPNAAKMIDDRASGIERIAASPANAQIGQG
jgi:hypothetical protein